MILFTLSMPNVGSWNGRWSGADTVYAKSRKEPKDEALTRIFGDKTEASFSYNFGDGWRASVYAEILPAAEANKILRKSKGFCGYDWMIDEIVAYGRIRTSEEREKKE